MSRYDLYRVSFGDMMRLGCHGALLGTGVTDDRWLLSKAQARALRKAGVACVRLTRDEERQWQAERG